MKVEILTSMTFLYDAPLASSMYNPDLCVQHQLVRDEDSD